MRVAVSADPEAAARAELRRQIGFLEARGGHSSGGGGGPRLLSLGELEAVRDAMTARTSHTPPLEVASGTFEAMLADPAGHRRTRIPLVALGWQGCGVYSVRPAWGLLGRLCGWWRVVLSSGCP